jgi:nicotinamide-nucleotide amidase
MNAIILAIGDELILGQSVDTNSAWMSQRLAGMGIEISAHLTVADDQPAIERAIVESARRCDLLLISGGLGPTADDLTRQALAAALGEPLETNARALRHLEAFFRLRKRPMPESNRVQAMIPRGAIMIENANGTAPGIEAVFGREKTGDEAKIADGASLGAKTGAKSGDAKKSCRIFVMPGVPMEMKKMFEASIAPKLIKLGGGAVILSRTLHTFGLGESAIAEKLGALMDRKRNPSVGTTVSAGLVSLRINGRSADLATAKQELDETDALCRAALGDLIYGQDETTLAMAVMGLLSTARDSEDASLPATVTTAESCTGGWLAKMITDIPGSSRHFERGWITYANAAKTELLGVEPATLEKYGAVSEPVVLEMAAGARWRAKATFALAISGVAGPDGGTAEKPVGTVCLAIARAGESYARTFNFPGDREMIRDRSAKMALSMLRYALLGKPLPF